VQNATVTITGRVSLNLTYTNSCKVLEDTEAALEAMDCQPEDTDADHTWVTARKHIRDFIHSFGTVEALMAAMSPPEMEGGNVAVPAIKSCSRKRKLEVVDTVSVAPLHVSRIATSKWLALLRRTINATCIENVDAEMKPMLSRSIDWRKRCQHEVRAVQKLLDAIRLDPPDATSDWLLHGDTYTRSCEGRTLTHYPQLGEAAFVQRLSKATRHAVTDHCYAEIDLSTAHIAAAWGAVEHHLGHNDAARLCPMLKLAATDKRKARGIVARERGCDPAYAKRMILMTLNQEVGDGIRRTGFLHKFIHERPIIMKALSAHPSIAGATHDAIVQSCQGHDKPSVREMALMLQRLEAQMLRIAVPVLVEHAFEVGAFIADGMLVRPVGGTSAGGTAGLLQKALVAVEASIRAELHVTATMDIEHDIVL